MTEEPKYKIGDPVWSKMKGYCPWPSRIAAPYESTLKNTAAEKQKVAKINYLVFFFGSNNFAWMPEDTIKPYAEFKEKNKSGGKTQSFKAGLKAIEDYIATDGQAKLLEDYNSYLNNQNNTTSAIKNNASNSNIDSSNSPSPSDESLNNDSNHDGKLNNQFSIQQRAHSLRMSYILRLSIKRLYLISLILSNSFVVQ